ncbi:hypothetical protein bcgnr5406_50290 [Bacillus cereus]|nr:hypothetical protein BCM0075_1287 [Bacillus cereus]
MKKVIQLLGITLGLVAVFGFSFTSNNTTCRTWGNICTKSTG